MIQCRDNVYSCVDFVLMLISMKIRRFGLEEKENRTAVLRMIEMDEDDIIVNKTL